VLGGPRVCAGCAAALCLLCYCLSRSRDAAEDVSGRCEFQVLDVARVKAHDHPQFLRRVIASERPVLLRHVMPAVQDELARAGALIPKSRFLDIFGEHHFEAADNVTAVSALKRATTHTPWRVRDWVSNLGAAGSTNYTFLASDEEPNHEFGLLVRRVLPWPFEFMDPVQFSMRFTTLSLGHVYGLRLHRHSPSWVGLLQGTKQWYAFAPSRESAVEYQTGDVLGKTEGVMRCLQMPGEIVYIPHMWWHSTEDNGDWTVAVGAQIGTWDHHYRDEGGGPLAQKVSAGNFDAVKTHVEYTNTEITGRHLHQAFLHGHADIARFLLQKNPKLETILSPGGNAPMNGKPILGTTAGHVAIAKLMLELSPAGSKLLDERNEDEDGELPIHQAARRGYQRQLEFFLSLAAYSKATTHSGNAPLHVAARYGHLPAVEVLVNRSASLDPRNGLQATPLHMAASAGHLRIVQHLVNHGAEVSATLQNGETTPLILAHVAGHQEIVEYLAGASGFVSQPRDEL